MNGEKLWDWMMINDSPGPDQLEVTVFGPGYGESIAIHYGNGQWCLVDSCLDPESGRPAALVYLEKMGVDVTTAVHYVVATHWHDDHIRGLAQIMQQAHAARFVCSVALKGREFWNLMDCFGTPGPIEYRGIREFREVFRQVFKRGSNKGDTPLVWVKEGTSFYLHLIDSIPKMSFLSPADASLTIFLQEIAEILAKREQLPPTLLPKRDKPNLNAVVMHIDAGENALLLGADLEEEKSNGWSKVLAPSIRPRKLANFFKVPHHGSKNADHPFVWSEMLKKDPIAVITPFSNGRIRLPRPEDLDRIQCRTSHVFLTAMIHGKESCWTKPDGEFPKHPLEEFFEGESALSGEPTFPKEFGYIRFRASLASAKGGWDVACFGTAHSISRDS